MSTISNSKYFPDAFDTHPFVKHLIVCSPVLSWTISEWNDANNIGLEIVSLWQI